MIQSTFKSRQLQCMVEAKLLGPVCFICSLFETSKTLTRQEKMPDKHSCTISIFSMAQGEQAAKQT